MKHIVIIGILVSIIFYLLLTRKMNRKKKIRMLLLPICLIGMCVVAQVSLGYFSEKPMIELNGQQTLEIEVGGTYDELGASGKYRDKDISYLITIQNTVDVNKVGDYEVVYEINYQNKKETIKRMVKVKDTTLPVIILKGQKTAIQTINQNFEEPGYEANDNYDGDITDKVHIEKEIINEREYKLRYTVKDSSGNEAVAAIRIVNIIEPVDESQSNKNVIYLTFDDGPSKDITPKILDILKEENVKATFFVLNFDSSKEALLKREVEEGHSIGIHGYSHEYKKIYQSVDTYMANINSMQKKIKEVTGITTVITRFPGGSSNTVSKFNPGIMTKLTNEVMNRGYLYYDWNVSSGDSGDVKTKEAVYHNVIKGLRKNRNNVVLMHDFVNNHKTLDALRDIIRYGKQNGYRFEAITPATPMVTQRVNN